MQAPIKESVATIVRSVAAPVQVLRLVPWKLQTAVHPVQITIIISFEIYVTEEERILSGELLSRRDAKAWNISREATEEDGQ